MLRPCFSFPQFSAKRKKICSVSALESDMIPNVIYLDLKIKHMYKISKI